jgi:branched-chain amino acid transport system substrate-binding protein
MATTSGTSRSARRVGLASIAVAALALAACSSSGGSSDSTKAGQTPAATGADSAAGSSAAGSKIPDGPIKIGMVAGISGSDSAIGGLVKGEFSAYIDYMNAHGGIAGHQIQLVVENNQSDPTIAVSAAKKLINEGVVATVYNGSSSEAKDQVVALEQRAKIIGIAPEALGQYDDAGKYPYYFTDNALNSQVTDALAAFAKKSSFDDVGVLGDSSPQGNDYLVQFAKSAKADGVNIVKSTSYPTGATTMTTQLSTLKEAGAKTLALFCYGGCGQVFDSLRQINWKPHVLVSPNVYYIAYASVKDYGDVTYSACPYSVEKGAKAPPGVAAAITAIAPKLGGPSPLDQVYAETADAMQILKYAIETAQSTDGDAMKAALETLNNKTFTDPSVGFTFNSSHRAGYTPNTPDKLIPICGFTELGDQQLPVRVGNSS